MSAYGRLNNNASFAAESDVLLAISPVIIVIQYTAKRKQLVPVFSNSACFNFPCHWMFHDSRANDA